MAPKSQKKQTVRHFQNGHYSVTPKLLRKYRKELGLPITTVLVVESIFACIGDDGTAWPSQQTIADEIDKSVDTVQEHISYLNDHCYLPIRSIKRGNGRVHNVYDLKPLIEFNAKLASVEEVPSMFPVSFTEWRQAKRAAGKGGKRGRPKKEDCSQPRFGEPKMLFQEKPRTGFGKPNHEHVPDIPDFVDGHLDYEPLFADNIVRKPSVGESIEMAAQPSVQPLLAVPRFNPNAWEALRKEFHVSDIVKLVRHIPEECDWVQAKLRLSNEEFAVAVEAGEASNKLVRFDIDGHQFLHTRVLGEYDDDAITLQVLRDTLRCGPEDLPEVVKNPKMLAAAVQEGVFQSVCSDYEILPQLFAEVCPPQDLIAARDRLCGEDVHPEHLLKRIIREMAARYVQRAKKVA
ncbi:helix-turn-helix domain-containing protein [Anaeromyxobacter soli]|uniref:helix-turn-helix domain-containing protein n=1 Tax=Anaeromyxobacter soli TaxID=2922725 RepID=UPI001FAFF7F4|nr:helix-turn-helix domain-containing protein [Anaeromyxobacter sp. SG29]